MRKCLICEKGNLERAEDIILEITGYVFVAKGDRCTHCQEEFPEEAETERLVTAARKLGVWPEPLKLYRHLSKSGGGLILRIPSDIERQCNLNESTEITVSKIGSKIIIEPTIS